jgi:hypothetical protein
LFWVLLSGISAINQLRKKRRTKLVNAIQGELDTDIAKLPRTPTIRIGQLLALRALLFLTLE